MTTSIWTSIPGKSMKAPYMYEELGCKEYMQNSSLKNRIKQNKLTKSRGGGLLSLPLEVG